jgi:signal transduction histidine kinase
MCHGLGWLLGRQRANRVRGLAVAGAALDNAVMVGAQVPASGPPAGLSRILKPLSVAVLVVASAGVVSGARGQPSVVAVGAVAALLVAAAGTAVVLAPRGASVGVDTAALVLVGLAGAVLAGLLADTPGFVIVYLALAGLGLRLPLERALAAGALVFAAMNLAAVLAGLSASATVSQDTGAVFVFAVGAFTRSARLAQEQARVAQERAEDLLSQLRASQAAQAEAAALSERARLAREIHDVLAHALSGLVLLLDTMELQARQAGADPGTCGALLEQISRAQRMAREGLADIKRAIGALRGDEFPGPGMLDRLVQDTASATGITAELTVVGNQCPVSPEMGLTLYRTAQEALTNTTKYAGLHARVELRLAYLRDALELVVEDIASDTGGNRAPGGSAGLTFGGYGLTGLRERAELLGGSLTAGPTATGFEVRLRLPTDYRTSSLGLVNGGSDESP